MNQHLNTIEGSDTITMTPVGRAKRRLAMKIMSGVLVTGSLVMGLGLFSATSAAPAGAMVDGGEAFAMETVTCNSARHTITVNFNSMGLPSSEITGGNGYFAAAPRFVTRPVYVWAQIYSLRTRKWTSDPRGYIRLPEGTSSLSYNGADNTYWYFTFKFANASGGYDTGTEWGGGGTGNGFYQWGGYNTQSYCAS